MLNYELAKKLKEAGFTQRRGCSACLQGYAFENGFTEEKIGDDYVASPTLEELIEACPKTITGPNNNTKEKGEVEHLFRLGFSGDEWFAHYEFYNSYILHEHGYVLDGWGKTPSIAVANLWLSLHTK